MTPQEFIQSYEQLGLSRRQFCIQSGISRGSADAYALGRAKIPLTVRLAIAALLAGLAPAGSEKNSTAA